MNLEISSIQNMLKATDFEVIMTGYFIYISNRKTHVTVRQYTQMREVQLFLEGYHEAQEKDQR